MCYLQNKVKSGEQEYAHPLEWLVNTDREFQSLRPSRLGKERCVEALDLHSNNSFQNFFGHIGAASAAIYSFLELVLPVGYFAQCFSSYATGCYQSDHRRNNDQGMQGVVSMTCRTLDVNFPYRSHKSTTYKHDFNPFPNKPWYQRVCRRRLSKTPWEKEKLLVTSNFSFSHSVFYPFGKLSAIFTIF